MNPGLGKGSGRLKQVRPAHRFRRPVGIMRKAHRGKSLTEEDKQLSENRYAVG
ncbi:hypothetical protein [Neisseria iguanae]|uniref:hypothetical protein n=1 Tax=Neisseria iguanae TaxID=90242 RepID=UPI0014760B26